MNKRQEKIWLNPKTNFFYIQRGIERTPIGSRVEIVKCNPGLQTIHGVLKGTTGYGLRNLDKQMIAYSYDTDDLVVFAIEHAWTMNDPIYHQLLS